MYLHFDYVLTIRLVSAPVDLVFYGAVENVALNMSKINLEILINNQYVFQTNILQSYSQVVHYTVLNYTYSGL